MTAGAAHPDDVARYYDRNTRRFLLVGRGRGSYSIHRELWGPGVASAREAADYVNRLVADEIADLGLGGRPVVLDFGCGVGGTLFHLAVRFPDASLCGMTVSPRQLDIAKRIATRLGLGSRCSFVLGDFQETTLGLRANAILAVESFAHAADRDAFLANASRHLAQGGHLIIVDDFLSAPRESLDARQRRLVDRLQAGWRVPGLCAPGVLIESATRHGLVAEKSVDLTPLTRPRSRARDHVVAALTPLFVRLGLTGVPFYGNMIGGDALQVGLREGFLRYRMVVLRRTA